MSDNYVTRTVACAQWLRNTIANSGGEVGYQELIEMAKLAGFSRNMLQRTSLGMPDLKKVNLPTWPKTSVWKIEKQGSSEDFESEQQEAF